MLLALPASTQLLSEQFSNYSLVGNPLYIRQYNAHYYLKGCVSC